ncbi:polyketide cyclase / dehydrase and lipid transport [Halalkalicoccus paucihalophilus]|uniref:Polyketide cyclase / dehydrase and lipid transport n=1 Tax=Halalkalicoccus paucihalophilus TaxID=1008153 RepID=A0A151ACH4_9EURY|nr:SRPBCC family protein [Halalkalicoccus paucihalophilus]KYH25329.1 polyketide cyclase / dehydrase and lipid transport [Halalkalicoccus paucihalophilus]
MVRIERDVWIDAEHKAVFEYMASPENHLNVMPSLHRIENVEELPSGGHRGEFRFKMVGIPIEGRFEDIEFVPNERRVYEMSGDVEGSMHYTFEPADGGTHFTCVMDVAFPSRVLDRVLRPVVRKYNEREVETMLANLKTLMETERKTPQPA